MNAKDFFLSRRNSFQSQYEKANNKWVFGSWIFGAVICLVLTVILGIWVLEASSGNINILVGRISLFFIVYNWYSFLCQSIY